VLFACASRLVKLSDVGEHKVYFMIVLKFNDRRAISGVIDRKMTFQMGDQPGTSLQLRVRLGFRWPGFATTIVAAFMPYSSTMAALC
jgi:hypothetical protein